MNKLTGMAALACAMMIPAAFADVDSDQVRGEIVSVDDSASTIELRITESGNDREAAVGSVQTYSVPEGTRIEYQIDNSIYEPDATTDLSDLSDGDTILLNFENRMGQRQATNVRNERTRNYQVQERVRREGRRIGNADDASGDTMAMTGQRSERTSLPASASPLPLLALIGLIFAGLGGMLRARRLGS